MLLGYARASTDDQEPTLKRSRPELARMSDQFREHDAVAATRPNRSSAQHA